MQIAELINLIKDSIRIEDLVVQFTHLRPSGDRLIGRCPFPHGGTPDAPIFEDSDSLTIYPRRGDFYCFGCHKGNAKILDLWGRKNYGSDVIAFWREIRRQQLGQEESFQDSLLSLARHIGLDVTLDSGPEPELYAIMEGRARRWHQALTNYPHVVRYLRQRGLSDDVIEEFRVGIVTDPNAGIYRHRVAIPILHEYSGKVLGFTYRTLNPEEKPKYIHSTTTEIWRSSEHLFGLYQARTHIAREGGVILTEDFFGPMALASVGIRNAVGMMGTILHERQAQILRRFTDTIYWWIEDEAGLKGLLQSLPVMQNLGFRIFMVEANVDADELVLRNDRDVEKIRKETASYTSYLPLRLPPLLQKTSSAPVDRVLEQLAEILRGFRRGADRALFGRVIKENFGVEPLLLTGD